MVGPGEKEGTGNKIKRKGGVTERVIVAPKERRRC
jgi:hypothetical protein